MTLPPFIQELENFGIKIVLPLDRVIYKYVSLKTALKIIDNNSLLFSSPQSYNDPFDLTNSLIDKKFDDKILKEWFEKSGNGAYSSEQLNELFEKTRNDPQTILTNLENTLNKHKSQIGITCFSKSHLKTLMWSHYADKHAGVCMGFNIVPIGISNFTLLEVNYANEIKPLNYFLNKPFCIMYWLYTKSKIWAYEEEVRAVYSDRNGIIPFDKVCLKEIHFGLRTSKEQQQDFITKLSQLGYKVNRMSFMTMNHKTFDLMENILQ
jgi:hypothetical protein